MRYAVGSDHAGLALKERLVGELRRAGHEVFDQGTRHTESVDYPVYAARVAGAVSSGRADAGLLVCGTGLGMAIAANRFAGVRAVTVGDVVSAEMARRHNDANVLCLGARVIGPETASAILRAWLGASFEGGRHERRVSMLADPASVAGGEPVFEPFPTPAVEAV
ncbi:MAG: ribose 5-phosphate isomerase B [Thermoleophilia bacterium]